VKHKTITEYAKKQKTRNSAKNLCCVSPIPSRTAARRKRRLRDPIFFIICEGDRTLTK